MNVNDIYEYENNKYVICYINKYGVIVIDIKATKMPYFVTNEELINYKDTNKKVDISDINDVVIDDNLKELYETFIKANELIFLKSFRLEMLSSGKYKKNTFYKYYKRFLANGRTIKGFIRKKTNYPINRKIPEEYYKEKEIFIVTNKTKKLFNKYIKYYLANKSNKYKLGITLKTSYAKMLYENFYDIKPSFKQYSDYYRKRYKIKRKSENNGIHDKLLNHRDLLHKDIEMARFPGHIAQIDSTLLDIKLVSSKDRTLLVGRPTLYFCIDVFSKLILGYYLTFNKPSYYEMSKVFIFMNSEKKEILKKYNMLDKIDYLPSIGIPSIIIADNQELATLSSESLVNNLGVEIINDPTRMGCLKGTNEKLFHLLNIECLYDLDGFLNKQYKWNKFINKEAVLNINELDQIILNYILFHNHYFVVNDLYMYEGLLENKIDPNPYAIWNFYYNNSLKVFNKKDIEIAFARKLNASVHDGIITYKNLRYKCDYIYYDKKFINDNKRKAISLYIKDDDVSKAYIKLKIKNKMKIYSLELLSKEFNNCYLKEVEALHIKQNRIRDKYKLDKDLANQALNEYNLEIVKKAKEEKGNNKVIKCSRNQLKRNIENEIRMRSMEND